MIAVRTVPRRRADTVVVARGRLDDVPDELLAPHLRGVVEAFVSEGDGRARVLALPGDRPGRVVVADPTHDTATEWRRTGGAVGRLPGLDDLTVALRFTSADCAAAFVEGLVLGDYRFSVSSPPPRRTASWPEADGSAVARGLASARATTWARDLANTRASTKTPAWLAAAARRVLTPLGVEVQVRDPAWLRAEGFGGVLAVGSGSAATPRLLEARWSPRGARTHLVIVGKGITFDSGGLNLKHGPAMTPMFTDMAGGAAALAALHAVAEARVPVRVSVLVPAAQNSLSGTAMRPGDVIRHYGGRTTEIRNTDAEGRLVLGDALAYAQRRLRPDAMVDVATLTGAAKVALGLRTAALLSTSDEVATALLAAAEHTDEPLWRLPLAPDYLPKLDSEIADAQNAPGDPGVLTAALFLRPFAGDVPWAHLDIAGPARAGADDGVIAKGATGFGTRLLARWVEAHAE